MNTLFFNLYHRFERLIKYFLCSAIATAVDVLVVWLLFNVLEVRLLPANTAGVLAGFAVSYTLSVRAVFGAGYSGGSFAVYFATFLLGLFLADLLIVRLYALLTGPLPVTAAFLLSKAVSVVLPFFVMYLLRSFLYARLKEGGR